MAAAGSVEVVQIQGGILNGVTVPLGVAATLSQGADDDRARLRTMASMRRLIRGRRQLASTGQAAVSSWASAARSIPER